MRDPMPDGFGAFDPYPLDPTPPRVRRRQSAVTEVAAWLTSMSVIVFLGWLICQ
jgi:hypothetical protein